MHKARRQFLGQISAVTLAALAAHARQTHAAANSKVGYGALRPVRDARGVAVLALPPGFELTTFSRIGEVLTDGGKVARNLDGMAAFERPGGVVRLIRNHEVRNTPGDTAGAVVAPGYDALAGAGCSVLDYDARKQVLLRHFTGLAGTHVNCAGGLAWRRRAWLSCEETTDGPQQGFAQKHGYVFAVPAATEAQAAALPLRAMGRFRHEAACADADGVVYLTEDAGSASGSGFYRFLPKDPAVLDRGGRLQILRARKTPQLDARHGQLIGARIACDWVDIAAPDPALEAGEPGCFDQGYARGAIFFNRLEGLALGRDGRTVYFTSTSGGDAKVAGRVGFGPGYGQVWRYSPTNDQFGTLALHFESPSGSVLDSPDNLCVTPKGGLLLCEDDASPLDFDGHALSDSNNINRLVGLGVDGTPFVFALNLLNASEFAGACFSPDGSTLFVNVFGDGRPGSGMSCAISGPWRRGPL